MSVSDKQLVAALKAVADPARLKGVLQSALRLANVSSDAINIITGVLLIVSVLSPRVLAWFKASRATRHRTLT